MGEVCRGSARDRSPDQAIRRRGGARRHDVRGVRRRDLRIRRRATARARPRRCASRSACSRPIAARCGGTASRSTETTRRQIGYMPEERGLYPRMKVGEQLIYLARLHGMSAPAAAAAVEEWTERLGVADRRDDEVQKLSLGNQQRVQLAAALVHDPADPRAGRAVLRARPGRRRRDERGAAGQGRRRRPGGVLQPPARPGGAAVRPGRHRPVAARWSPTAPSTSCAPAAPDTLVVEVAHAPAGWWRTAARCHRSCAPRGTALLLSLPDGADDQTVLRAALATGPVREFGRHRPPLTDLFRHIVTGGAEPRRGSRPSPSTAIDRAGSLRMNAESMEGRRAGRPPGDQHPAALQGIHRHHRWPPS